MRKNLSETNNTDSAVKQNLVASDSLTKLVESYIVNKQNENEYKKQASAENTQIKEIMAQYGMSSVETELGTATLSEQKRESFIEEKLIEFLKERGLEDGIVKTKEYVDFDSLESAIYHEVISGDNLKDMSNCKEVTITQVLRIKAKKG